MDNKDFEQSLADKFAQLYDKTRPPAELKKEVFKTIDTIKDVSEILDLFVVKFPITNIDLISGVSGEDIHSKKP